MGAKMPHKRLKQRLVDAWGKMPDAHYFAGDMELIRLYADYRGKTGRDGFLLDDITWRDLDMDRLFRRINPRRSTSGEQYLYYQLRSPALERQAWQERLSLIHFAEEDPARRLRVELILARLGCSRRADLCKAFAPEQHGAGLLRLYLILLLLLLGAVLGAVLGIRLCLPVVFCVLCLNFALHAWGKRKAGLQFDTVNYSVAMVYALHRLRKLGDPGLDRLLTPAYKSLYRLRGVLRMGGVSTISDGALGDMLASATLLDLITYEYLKNKLGRCFEDVFTIHEYLGKLDAAVAIASYRASLGSFAEAELDFSGNPPSYMEAEAVTHPLLPDAVPNDILTEKPLLITGSNASGKTTYLKSGALAAIMAQSICTVTAAHYRASAFRIYSSISIQDDLLAGESYYMADIRSLKRILDAAESATPLLCVVDEVLRGTNTVERIAASCALLAAFSEAGVLCLAATHDIELCSLLKDRFRLYHFTEIPGERDLLFDYRLRSGPATSRNAILLLSLMGFDRTLVESADARAAHYLETGRW